MNKTHIHHLLSLSYITHFVAILGAFLLQYIVPFAQFAKYQEVGFLLMFVGTWLVFYSQHISRKKVMLRKDITLLTSESFEHGPYKFLRSPTHVGLFILSLGFSFMTGMLWMFIMSAVAFVVTKFTFLRQEEKILRARYGDAYVQYEAKHPF
jgi:protein-S-isoprenylcysteine O-methyltransferase Ste14